MGSVGACGGCAHQTRVIPFALSAWQVSRAARRLMAGARQRAVTRSTNAETRAIATSLSISLNTS